MVYANKANEYLDEHQPVCAKDMNLGLPTGTKELSPGIPAQTQKSQPEIEAQEQAD